MQDAPSIKVWGPYFDGFVDISIFMIWGSLGVVWLDGIFVLRMGYLLYVWDICLMYGILVSCFGKTSKSHVTRVQLWRSVLSYVWDIGLMFGVFVLCMVYLSYVWAIHLMYGILVLCLRNINVTRMQLWRSVLSYVWDISLTYGY